LDGPEVPSNISLLFLNHWWWESCCLAFGSHDISGAALIHRHTAMLWLFASRVGCRPDVPSDLLVAWIVLTPFSHGTLEMPANHALVLEFPDPQGLLVLGGDCMFYVETPLGWFQPASPVWGLISMGPETGFVEVVAQSDTTLSYAATYFGSSCDTLSAYGSASIALQTIPANITQCFVTTSTDSIVTVTGTLPAMVNFARPGGAPMTAIPGDGLRFTFSDGPFMIICSESDASSDIMFNFGRGNGNDIGTLSASDAKLGLFQVDHWADFVAISGPPPTSGRPEWTPFGYALILGIVVLIMVFVLAVILRVMFLGVPWRKPGDAHGRDDLAPDVTALRDIEDSPPAAGAASDSSESKEDCTGDRESPGNPYDGLDQTHGFL
jgi:hypothetical protein